MTSRWCVLTLGAWLPLCLLSGCVFNLASRSTSIQKDPGPPPPAVEEPPPSPYQGRPNPIAKPNDQRGPSVEQPGNPDSAVPGSVSIEPSPDKATPSIEKPAIPGTPEPAAPVSPAGPETGPQIVSGNTPPQPELPLVAAFRAFVQGHPEEALELVAKLDEAGKEMWMTLLPLVALVGEDKLKQASPIVVAQTLDELNRKVAARLRERAPLVLDKLTYCQDIKAFGVYDPYPLDHGFQAGIGGKPGERVQVYVEVRNFTSRDRNGYFETCLDSTLEIMDQNGYVVWRMDFPATPDRSQTARQDFFLAYRFHVPPRMPLGEYVLWVVVREKPTEKGHSERQARKSIKFHVNPDSHPPSQRAAGLP